MSTSLDNLDWFEYDLVSWLKQRIAMENQRLFEAVNQIIQRRLALSNSDQIVHLHSRADMGVEIEVDGKIYSDLSEIDDNAIRELIQTSIQEWETEQNISELNT